MQATKNCPYCGEEILAVAIKCKHCQSMLNNVPAPPTTPLAETPKPAAEPEPADTLLDLPAVSPAPATPSATNTSEQTVLDVGATLKRGFEAVGGRLLVTTQGLHFRAHLINLQKMPLDLGYDEIASVAKHSNLGFVPNGLIVTLHSGQEYRLTITRRDQVWAYVQERVAALGKP